jgi:hypothetical protein
MINSFPYAENVLRKLFKGRRKVLKIIRHGMWEINYANGQIFLLFQNNGNNVIRDTVQIALVLIALFLEAQNIRPLIGSSIMMSIYS